MARGVYSALLSSSSRSSTSGTEYHLTLLLTTHVVHATREHREITITIWSAMEITTGLYVRVIRLKLYG